MTAPVDVLAVMDCDIELRRSVWNEGRGTASSERTLRNRSNLLWTISARAAVAELIAADKEYDDAMRAAHSTQHFSIRAQQQAMTRLVAARARRRKALQDVTAVSA